jgi:hypothetical protein
VRRVHAEGGFASILAHGDDTAGAILLVTLDKGQVAAILERVLAPDGQYEWIDPRSQHTDSKDEIDGFVARRRARDPDLWVVELDIPDAARFAAEMGQQG